MTEVLMYWNNICILHKKEKEVIDKITADLLDKEIILKTCFFGLGYGEHMGEYLAKKEAVLPDVVVSADLEVFEDERIFKTLAGGLHKMSDMVPLRNCEALEAVQRSEELLPFLAIPLVYYTKNKNLQTENAIEHMGDLAFGGINNSAAKTVVKAVWSRYGSQNATELLSNAHVTGMPIEAFAKVQKGENEVALVPSVYALRADGKNSFLKTPKEGVFLTPSYICARTSISSEVAKTVISSIAGKELCEFYAEAGDLIVFPDCCKVKSKQENGRYCAVEKEFLKNTSAEQFYALYRTHIQSAQEPNFA